MATAAKALSTMMDAREINIQRAGDILRQPPFPDWQPRIHPELSLEKLITHSVLRQSQQPRPGGLTMK